MFLHGICFPKRSMHGRGRTIHATSPRRFLAWGAALTAYTALPFVTLILSILCSTPPFSTIFQIRPKLQRADEGPVPGFASSAPGFAGTQTGLTTRLANGCRHRAGTHHYLHYFSSYFFLLVSSVARLVDPACDQVKNMAWHDMAWHLSAGLIFTIRMGCAASSVFLISPIYFSKQSYSF